MAFSSSTSSLSPLLFSPLLPPLFILPLQAKRKEKEKFELEGEPSGLGSPASSGFSLRSLRSMIKGQAALTPAEREQLLLRLQQEVDALAESLDQRCARLRAFEQQLLAEVRDFEEVQADELSGALASYCRRMAEANAKALQHWEKCERAFESL